MEDKAEKPANDMSNGAVKNVSEEQNAPEEQDEPSPPNELDSTQRYIDSNDTCLTCKKTVDISSSSDTVCCLFCDYKFHAICTDSENNELPDNISTKSFLDLFQKRNSTSGVNSKRKGNFVFVCDTCRTHRENVEAGDIKTHVKSLESKIVNLESDISDIKSILLNGSHPQLPTKSPLPTKSHATVSATNPWDNIERVKSMRSNAKLIIGGNDPSKGISKTDLETIAVNNKLPVERLDINNGKTVLTFPTQNDRDKAESKLREAYPHSDIRQASDLLPTISIANISNHKSPEDLTTAILQFNPEIETYVNNGGIFKVLGPLRKQNKNEMLQANVRVSNNIRKLLENAGNRVCTGFGYSCRVYDHFHIKRCNTCQKYHHYYTDCPTKTAPVCAYCAGSHQSDNCQNRSSTGFIPTCVNCKLDNNQSNINHESFSITCPTYKRAQDALRNSILYYNSKNL